jgi:hypothetical protein
MNETRKSDRIAALIAKANQVAMIDWMHAVLEERGEPLRKEMAELQTSIDGRQVVPVMDFRAIDAPVKKKGSGSAKFWAQYTPEERTAIMQRRSRNRKDRQQAAEVPVVKVAKTSRRPSKQKASATYWAQFTPEERTAEMKRRFQVRQEKKFGKLHPRDSRHPKHAEWVEKLRTSQKKRISGMSVRERKEWNVKMQAGREKAHQRINGEATL